MIKITAQRGEVEAYVIEFVVDTRSDIQDLAIKYPKSAAGSTCICVEDSSVWMLSGDGAWHEL